MEKETKPTYGSLFYTLHKKTYTYIKEIKIQKGSIMTTQKAKEMADVITNTLLGQPLTKLDARRQVMSILTSYGVVKNDRMQNYTVEGQMDITDFPAYMPDGYDL